jgi:transposase
MRFVPLKTVDHQSRLMVHAPAKATWPRASARSKRIRGLMSEFGIVLPQKAEVVRRDAALHLEDLPGYANTVIGDSLSEALARGGAHVNAKVFPGSEGAKGLSLLRA